MNVSPSRLLKAAAVAFGLLAGASAMAQTAICYNCPPEWADWASQLRAIKSKTGITVPPDNKNSGQTLAQLVAEKASPVADIAYYGVTFGVQAKKDGVTAAYKPSRHGPRSPMALRIRKATGSPSTRAPWASWSTSMHSRANRCRDPGPTCSSPNTRA
jgi:hypothetical protein